ncbi:MAG: RES family NAD+ phosphorylase [Mucilaginibacter sp.]|uniref:RES family NAD+ phosphorylase n=1 Tax=Mucilaginibacter sp. TaxID=1882438 RepID=UPI0034E56048
MHKKYGDPLYAPGIEGRWNSAGKKVLYGSDSIPLAFMESMIRRQGVGFNNDFKIAHIEIPDYLAVKKLEDKELGSGWNKPNDYSKTQPLANKWYDNLETLVLIVPSAVLSTCNNYVINAIHPDFDKIKLIALTPLIPDPRIEEILKGKIIS